MKKIKEIIDGAMIAKLNNLGCTPTERSILRSNMKQNLFTFFEQDVNSLLLGLGSEWRKYGGTIRDMNGKIYEAGICSFASGAKAGITFSLLNTNVDFQFKITNEGFDFTNGYHFQGLVGGRVFTAATLMTFEEILAKIMEETLTTLSEKFSPENFR